MRKIINRAEDVVTEQIEGFTAAYSKLYIKHPVVNGILFKYKRHDKVALVIGGGSGHEPMFSGFVGKGLADGAACGNIFASPDPGTIYETAKAVESGKGVLFVYGCYSGDNLNFDMGEEFLNKTGIKTAHVRVQDDIASAVSELRENRRGIAGDVFVIKIAGAACDCGMDLDQVKRIAEKANRRTFSIGVATSSAQLPGAKELIFKLEDGKIEYGMGLHGEKGVLRTDWDSADELTERMYEQLMTETCLEKGESVCVLVNGLGSTTIIELSIVYRKLKELLEKDGVRIYDADLNSYCTSQEMGGFSISILRLDHELKKYFDMPCHSPYYTKEVFKEEKTKDYDSLFNTVEQKEKDVDSLQAYIRKEQYNELDAEDCSQMLLYVARQIRMAEPVLTRIDSAIGDGDHGIGMKIGMMQLEKVLSGLQTDNAYQIFASAGEAMLMSMGGASGIIFGSLFLSGTENVLPKKKITGTDLAVMFEKSLQAIQERGGAGKGDKTMVDALLPAVKAMKKSAESGLEVMLAQAEAAARAGALETKNMIAGFGRAKSLGGRAIGYPDAGAVSTWLIFWSMHEFVVTGQMNQQDAISSFIV